MNRPQTFVVAALATLLASTASAYVLLSPRRTWPDELSSPQLKLSLG